MNLKIKKNNVGTLLLSSLTIAILSACGSGSSDISPAVEIPVPVVTPPVVTPPAAIASESIEGNFTQIIPSNTLPSRVLPSNALPSNILPSNALPSNVLPSSESESGDIDVQEFRVTLMANQEPLINVFDSKVNKDAEATGILRFNHVTDTLSGSVSVENLSVVLDPTSTNAPSNAVSAVHLHRMGFAGKNGQVLTSFGPDGSDEIGIFDDNIFEFSYQLVALDVNEDGDTLDDEDISIEELKANLLSGGFYFNVHTNNNKAGQLRGQVTPENIQVVRVELQTEQTIPQVEASTDNVGGVGYFTFNDQEMNVGPVVNLTVNGFEPTAAHVHVGGFAGSAGPVQVPLTVVDSVDGVTRYTSPADAALASLPGVLKGAYYLNVHSEANPSGEIRGQILARNTVGLRNILSSDTGSATGVGYLTADFKTFTLNTNVQTIGLSPLPTLATLFPLGGDQVILLPADTKPEGFFGTDMVAIPEGISQDNITTQFSLEVKEAEYFK